MHRWFSIPRKSKHIGLRTLLLHLDKLVAQSSHNLLASRHPIMSNEIVVETAFTIDAVERTALPIVRQQIDAQRHTQPAAVNRSKDRRII
jgi:hypothetical protein